MILPLILLLLASTTWASSMTTSLPPHPPASLKRTLVFLEDAEQKNSSSSFFESLQSRGHALKFRKVSEDGTMSLKTNGEWDADNVVVLVYGSTSPNDRSVVNLLEFVDNGGNVLLASTGQSKFARDFAVECGVRLVDSRVIDRFAPSAEDYVAAEWPRGEGPRAVVGEAPSGKHVVRFAGSVAEPTPEAVALGAVRVLSGTLSTFQSKRSADATTPTVGAKIDLVTAVQMRNNARVTVSGSPKQFHNSFAETNLEFNARLSKWTFAEASVLRVNQAIHRKADGSDYEKQMSTRGMGDRNLPRSFFPDPAWGPDAKLYKIRDDVVFNLDIDKLDFDGTWKPYIANDIQVEFAMLDPYQRRTFERNGSDGKYVAKFTIPDQYGTFAFRVVYNRPGLSSLRILDSVNVRPFRHDEFERFIGSAFPYYTAVGGGMLGFLIFSLSFACVASAKRTKTD